MNVLGVVTDTDRRGAQTFGVQLGRRLAELGASVRTVALRPGSGGGFELEVLGPGRWSPSGLRRLRRLMAEADVTVAHGSSTLPACALASRGSGRPFVYRQISDPLVWAPAGLRRWRVQRYYRCPDHVVALTQQTGEVLTSAFGVPPGALSVIPNAVDDTGFTVPTAAERDEARARLGLDPEQPVVAYVGALVEEKGLGDLVAAATPRWRLLLAGTGAWQPVLEQRAAAAGVDITFLGAVAEPVVAYHAADVVVLPSWSEQHPAVVLEAALSGAAVVATDVGAVAELVLRDRTGLLVAPHAPASLRRAVEQLLADPVQRAAMAAVGREHVRSHFTMEAVAPRWLALLADVAARS